MEEKEYPVFWQGCVRGKVQVRREGLYDCFSGSCRLPEGKIYKAAAIGGGKTFPLSVLVPEKDGFAFSCRRAAKEVPEGELSFAVFEKGKETAELFCPVYPGQPFKELARISEGCLAVREGITGIVFPQKGKGGDSV